MPELPDVEGFRRVFARHAAGKRVRGIHGIDASMLRNTSASRLGRALKGRRFTPPNRHGKLLICPTDGPMLVLHFGMTGGLIWSGDEPQRHVHDRLVRELDRIVGPLGPDWLDVSRERLDELLAGRRASIKSALMDQHIAAGLGNLTADEALWQARIDPRRPIASLDTDERDALYRKIQKVLRDSLPYGYVPGKRTWLTGTRGRGNGVCPRCGAQLERTKVGGRTTVFCPREQSCCAPRGSGLESRPAADRLPSSAKLSTALPAP